MKTVFSKRIVAIISLPIAMSVMGMAIYNLVEIRPKLSAISAILQNASPQDRNPPEMIKTLIDKTPNSENFVIYELLRRFYPPASQRKWHIRQVLWQILLPLNLSREQRYGLFSTLAYTGLTDEQGNLKQGLNNFALYRYGKPLDQLTPYQSATVVVITHSPTHLLRNEALLNQRATWLLSQMQTP